MRIHEEYTYEVQTVAAGATVDFTSDPFNKRIRWIQPIGYTCQLQGKEKGYAAATIAHYSTTGAFTGVDAECADFTPNIPVNFDKLFVHSTSSPVRIFVVKDEVV
jgi:hypothetical protein